MLIRGDINFGVPITKFCVSNSRYVFRRLDAFKVIEFRLAYESGSFGVRTYVKSRVGTFGLRINLLRHRGGREFKARCCYDFGVVGFVWGSMASVLFLRRFSLISGASVGRVS